MAPEEEVRQGRVRAGLVVVSVVFLVALAILLFVDDPLARLVMTLVMATAVVRAVLLVRGIRRERAAAPSGGDETSG